MDTNEIGFYVNSRMGLCFTLEILNNLIIESHKFKNAILVVYDSAKSNYGMNPLHAYRLSDIAMQSFNVD